MAQAITEKNAYIAEFLEDNSYELASFKSRVLAFLIDTFIVNLLVMAMFWEELRELFVLITLEQDNVEAIGIANKFVFPMIFINLVYEIVFTKIHSATLGKIWLKIRIVNPAQRRDTKLNFLICLNRAIFKYIGAHFFCYLSYLSAYHKIPLIGDIFSRTLHDFSARTIVIKNPK